MKKYPPEIFDKETPQEKKDRQAMEGKIQIFDKRCEKCNNFANYCIRGRFFCTKHSGKFVWPWLSQFQQNPK